MGAGEAGGAMKVAVVGLWHLGCVTAACCARHFTVAGWDMDARVVEKLREGQAPVHEPGLNERLAEGLKGGRLSFSADAAEACAGATILWLTHDTPVDEEDRSDVDAVLASLRRCMPHLAKGSLTVISSQLPVGTCRRLESEFPRHRFACVPENLRLGKALAAFEEADRFVAGCRDEAARAELRALLEPFTGEIVWMGTESAEMVKHALNAFLALSITFINEIASVCEQVGADAREVSAGLKSDTRIGRKAYLGPGGPFAGGTLARDVVTLTRLGREHGDRLRVIPAIKESNDLHRQWAWNRLAQRLEEMKGKIVAVLGLTYKPDTDTLRRSAAVELCRQLAASGARVRALDPAVVALPDELSEVRLEVDPRLLLRDADAAVICTEWPDFREWNWSDLILSMRSPVVVDANGFLEKELKSLGEVEHLCVGSHT